MLEFCVDRHRAESYCSQNSSLFSPKNVLYIIIITIIIIIIIKQLRTLSLRANYTDRATAVCR
jgi:hypothetical protein